MKLKYEKDVQVLEIQNILDESENLFSNCSDQALRNEGIAEVKFVHGLSSMKKIRQLLKNKE